MKKVKTLIAVFVCIFIGALFGGCSCSQATVSVVSINLIETSDNLYYDEVTGKYLIRQDETFTITYEILPNTASDKTVMVDCKPPSKINTDVFVVNTNEASKTLSFKTSKTYDGEAEILISTKDGTKSIKLCFDIVGNLTQYNAPDGLAYDEASESFTWNKSSLLMGNGTIDATQYQVKIESGDQTEEFITETNSLEYKLQNGTDYYVQVRALGTLEHRTGDSTYTESRFYVVKPINNFVADNGNLSWEYDDVDNITGFQLKYGNNPDDIIDIEPNGKSYNFADFVLNRNLTETTYSVSISALNTSYRDGKIDPSTNIKTYILPSRGNPQVNLTKLSQPGNARIETTAMAGSIVYNSILKWDNVVNSDYYTYVIRKNGEIKSENQMQVSNNLNLTTLLNESGEYTIEISPVGNKTNTFTLGEQSKTTLNFVVLPTLEGTIDYRLDKVTLNTADIVDMLGISASEIDKLGYEIFYAEDVSGEYTDVVQLGTATRELILSDILNISSGTQFSILVRPYATSSYQDKQVVLSNISVIERQNTVRGILQLTSAYVEKVNETGVATVVDNNTTSRVDKYKFILAKGGTTLEKEVYKSNITFIEDSTSFEISLTTMFNIQDVATYQVKVVPISDRNIDANPYSCNAYEFTQLGSIDIGSVEIENNRISWTDLANRDSYLVKINGEVVTDSLLDNFYQVSELSNDVTTVEISIQALGNGTDKINGAPVVFTKTRSQAVNNIRIVDGALTWDDIANSLYYVIITDSEGNSDTIETEDNSYAGLNTITSGVSITVVRNTPNTFTSVESDSYNIEKLSTPTANLEIKNHSYVAVFSENTNTIAYKVNIYDKNDTLIRTHNLYIEGADQNATVSDGKVEFELPTLAAGEYNLYIQSMPINQTSDNYETNGNKYYLISEFSEANRVVVYPQVEITNKTGNLVWSLDTTESVDNYVINFTNDEYSDITTADTSYNFEEIVSGTYVLNISATSTETNVIYAAAVEFTITKVETPTLAFENSTITFTAVENANGYNVYNQAGTLLTSGTDYDITTNATKVIITPKNVAFGEVYELSVSAIGAENIINGDTSNTIKYTRISSVENITFTTDGSDKVFNWNAVDDATGYQVIITRPDGTQLSKETTNTNTYKIPAMYITGNNKLAEGNYTLSIETVGSSKDGVYFFNADATTQVFTKLTTISNMAYSSGIITWSYTGSVAPVSYKLSVREMNDDYVWNEVTVATINGDVNSYDLANLSDYSGYKIYITAIGSDETYTIDGEEQLFTFTYTDTNGEEKTTSIFTKLSTPSITYDSLGNMYISEVVGAENYEIYSYDGNDYTLLTDEYSLDSSNKLTLNTNELDYTIVIKTIASTASGMLDSVYSDAIKINQLAVANSFAINTNGAFTWSAVENASGYLIYCDELAKEIKLEGGNTLLIGYEALIEKFEELTGEEISLDTNYTFSIRAYGAQDVNSEVYYLMQNQLSDNAYINAVNGVNAETVIINNGLISWGKVSNVNSYILKISEKLGVDNYNHIVSFTVNSTCFDVTNITNLIANKSYVASIAPFSTTGVNYVIVKDTTEPAEIGFSRYNVINNVAVEEGIIKLTINIAKIDTADIPTLIACKNYADLPAEISEKYKGYYTFKFDIGGYGSHIVTLSEMYNITYSLVTFTLTAYYELGLEVQETTLLDIKITSVGNSGDSTTTYNALSSFSSMSNRTEFQAYKYPAPTPTAVQNLITENGDIYFNKCRLSDGTLVDKYYLKVVGNQKSYFYKIEIPAGQENVQTYTLTNVFDITYNYYGSAGELLSGKLSYDQEYMFTLTTMGNTMVNGQPTYLRSNKYASISITFLEKVSPFRYTYDALYSNGGYLTWNQNPKCLGYEIYFLNQTIAQNIYGSDFENVKTNSSWIDNDNVVSFILHNSITAFNFYSDEANVLNPGNYLVAIKAIGNGIDYISAPAPSSTVVVYKMNSVNNLTLNNGSFSWQASNADASLISGYKIMIQVFKDGALEKTVEKRELVTTTSYVLEEFVYDMEGNVHNFRGEDETYGLIVIAVGKNDSNYQAVCSRKSTTNNALQGYARLNTIILNVNTSYKRVDWEVLEGTPNKNNTLKYIIYNKGVANWGVSTSYHNQYLLFSELTQVGDYKISVQVIASGNQYLNSLLSEEVTIIKYYPPQLAVNNGQLVWESVQNGNALTPAFSTITINKDGAEVKKLTISDFEYSLSDNQYLDGKYTITVKFEDNYANDAYSIASDVATIDVYKLAKPTVSIVNKYDGESSKYDSALKWPVVKNNLGSDVMKYQVKIYDLVNGEITEQESFVMDNANYDAEYFNIVTDGDDKYIHFNIKWVASKYTGEVTFGVTTLGNTMTYQTIQNAINNSEEYYAYINSSEGSLMIEYNAPAPQNASNEDEIRKGIIKWHGSNNPVHIEMVYENEDGDPVTESVYLSSDYITRYGKVYYLPYMVKYNSVRLEFVIDNSIVSDVNIITMGDKLSLYNDGDGSKAAPYTINTAEQLYNIKYRPLSHFVIGTGIKEIDMSAYTWDMIDKFAGSITGYMDADNKATVVSNLKLAHTKGDDVNPVSGTTYSNRYKLSLFNIVDTAAVIRDIQFNFTIAAYQSGGTGYDRTTLIAGISQYNLGTINNVIVSGSIDGRSQSNIILGGVAYKNYGKIFNTKVKDLDVILKATNSQGSLYASGITYENYGVIDAVDIDSETSFNLGYDTANNKAMNRVASGVAYKNSGVILNTDFKGELIAWSMAGIAYLNMYENKTISIAHTYQVEGEIIAEYTAGTIIGCSNTGILRLYSDRITDSNIYIGGIAAQNQSGLILKSYNVMLTNTMDFSAFTGSQYVGGIVGFTSIAEGSNIYPYVENCYSIISAEFANNSGSATIGSVVGAFSNTQYPTGYGLVNVVTYSSSYDVVGEAKITSVQKVNFASSITSYVDTILNQVSSTHTAINQHARDFEVAVDNVILKQQKTLINE